MPSFRGKPEPGDYLENGKTMIYVTGYTDSGDLKVEDANTEETATLSSLKGWRRVSRRKRGD